MLKTLRRILDGTPARPPVTAAPDPRCTAIRYNGQRCKLPSGPDGYCGNWNHTAAAQKARM